MQRKINRLYWIPLLQLAVTGRCNSRCVMCDFWKRPAQGELDAGTIERLVSSLKNRGLRSVLITGGEPLLREDVFEVCARIARHGLKLILSTNGLLLEKLGGKAARYFRIAIVSLDSHEADAYKRIRGGDDFNRVVDGIRVLKEHGATVFVAHTLQAANIGSLLEFLEFSRRLGVDKVSVRPVDALSGGFARNEPSAGRADKLVPGEEDIERFSRAIDTVGRTYARELRAGVLKPDVNGWRMIHDYFLACRGRGRFPPRECHALYISLTVEANGDIRPCFFLPPVANVNGLTEKRMEEITRSEDLVKVRRRYRDGDIGACRMCVQPYSADL